ncbi:MFS transporter [Clostridium sp. PL3]|uniref:MFS-type drug efflux transporter P55 n=1 Tax=Clostridium thailandense TaxID=2794346 RepID=A0A949U3E0_9CLOT|nr:MFS transporter [Clostridium thailandense]MBV7276661.1 MFS transporter [Clostridium thailandense]
MPEVLKPDGLETMSSKRKTLCAIAILICGFAYWSTRYKANALLPMISGELNGLTYYSWAPMVFSLTGAISAPFWGKMGDIYGKKKILLTVLGIMVTGEILCFSAPNIWFFIAGYAVNGFGAGAMQGTYMALLGQLFPPTERGKIGGTILSVMSVVQLTLPTLAALISEHWTWRYVFVLTAIIFLITFFFVMFAVPNVIDENADKRIDIFGVITLAIAVSNFLLALSWGGSKFKWNSPTIIIMLLVSIIVFVLFFKHEEKIQEYSIISTKLLKNRNFLACCLISVSMTFGLTCVATYLSLYVQGVMGKSATVYATLEIPASFIGIFMGAFAGFMMDKTKHYKWMLVLAPSCAVITMSFFGLMPATISLIAIIAARAIYNVGGGSWMPSINTLSAMAYIKPKDYGVGNGTLFFFTALGNALSPALLGSILNTVYAKFIVSNISNLSLNPKQVSLVSTARVLVNKDSLKQLKATFADPSQYNTVVQVVRNTLQTSLRSVFMTAACFICIGVISALILKEIPLDQVEYKGRLRK